REEGTGDREQGRGKREEGTGDREQGRGKREEVSGNFTFRYIFRFFSVHLLVLYHAAMIYLIATDWVKIVENESLFFLH
ncbi:MAG: hypothetical protein AN487_13605, partial [Anabaena sp. CRKS33]